MTGETKVERLTVPQTREAGRVLARAFHDDPGAQYCCPDDAKRVPRLEWLFTVSVRLAHRYGGEVYTTEGTVNGGSVWLCPGNFPIGLLSTVRTGMVLAPLKLGLPAFVRFMRCMTPLEHLHKDNAPARHWYLQWLGVDPPRQGQGIGSALMQPVLARADADGLVCYLETANARTVPLYQRHGFEVVVEGDLPKGAPHFWTMMRAPRG